jgi:hypothetical protein
LEETSVIIAMRICYLTGHELIEKTGPEQLDNHESLEHIIPNALGGKLASKDILSHGANRDLNDLVDVRFVKTFESFITKLNFGRDRNTKRRSSGVHQDYQKDVIFKDDRFFPKKPFFDEERMVIFADSEKTGENYKSHLIKKGVIREEDGGNVKVYDDMAGPVYQSFFLDNKNFKQGLAKIAAGFASFKGISRRNLKNVIDIDRKALRDDIILAPSIPLNPLEWNLENSFWNSKNYPIHGLTLKGCKKENLLYCHVELFSAFQWYVLLDDDYAGEDIEARYIYDILGDAELDQISYLHTVLCAADAAQLSQTHKIVSRSKFIGLQHMNKDIVKKYNHAKFYRLLSFSNHIYLKRKAKALGLR